MVWSEKVREFTRAVQCEYRAALPFGFLNHFFASAMPQPSHSRFLQSLVSGHVGGGKQSVPALIGRLQQGVLYCLLFLIALGLWQELYFAPTGNKTLVLKVVPWLLALPGVYRHKLYTFRVLSLLLWLYVLGSALDFGVLVYGVNTAEMPVVFPVAAAIQLGLCLLLFVLCGRYVRARLANGLITASAKDSEQ